MTVSVLPAITNRLVLLLEGYSTNVTRAIAARRFEHIDIPPEAAIQMASQAPYPFEIVDDGEFQPSDVPSTLSGDQVWYGALQTVRIGYAADVHNTLARQQVIHEDRAAIRRTVTHPRSWDGVTGFSRATIESARIVEAEALGGDAPDPEAMLMLEVSIAFTYREDFS